MIDMLDKLDDIPEVLADEPGILAAVSRDYFLPEAGWQLEHYPEIELQGID